MRIRSQNIRFYLSTGLFLLCFALLFFALVKINPIENSFVFYVRLLLAAVVGLYILSVITLLQASSRTFLERASNYVALCYLVGSTFLLPIDTLLLDTPSWFWYGMATAIHLHLLTLLQVFHFHSSARWQKIGTIVVVLSFIVLLFQIST